jgi:hypothetical protein
MEISLKSQASDWLKQRPASDWLKQRPVTISANQMLEI